MAKCTGMRCPMKVGFEVDECNYEDCPYRTEPQTNADKIRAMSDEELVELLEYELLCPATGNCEKMNRDCKACWLDWLQQSAEEGER